MSNPTEKPSLKADWPIYWMIRNTETGQIDKTSGPFKYQPKFNLSQGFEFVECRIVPCDALAQLREESNSWRRTLETMTTERDQLRESLRQSEEALAKVSVDEQSLRGLKIEWRPEEGRHYVHDAEGNFKWSGDPTYNVWRCVRLSDELAASQAQVAICRDCLESKDVKLGEICEGKGPFSRDPLQHASNTIEAMRELAMEALALKPATPSENESNTEAREE